MTIRKSVSFSLIVIILLVGLVSLFPRAVAHAGDASDTTDSGVAQSKLSHVTEQTAVEANQEGLLASDPQLKSSQERVNLINRLKLLNNTALVGYVALIGNQGQLVAYYTIKGKVTSLNSYLTSSQQEYCANAGAYNGNDWACTTVDSPDLDGSYGQNPEGIFFFTTSGSYVEWSGSYLYSNQPLTYAQQPLLVETQK